MNQDLRRMAEEAELPEPVAYGAMDDYGNYEVSRNPICANGDRLLPEKQVREAIANALVKFAQVQEAVAWQVGLKSDEAARVYRARRKTSAAPKAP